MIHSRALTTGARRRRRKKRADPRANTSVSFGFQFVCSPQKCHTHTHYPSLLW